MDPDTIREINRIPKGTSRVHGGRAAHGGWCQDRCADISPELAENATMAVEPDMPDLRRAVVRAGRRDTVTALSRRYGVSVCRSARGTSCRATPFRAARNVVLMLPQARAGGRAASQVRAIRVDEAQRVPRRPRHAHRRRRWAGKPVVKAKPGGNTPAKRKALRPAR